VGKGKQKEGVKKKYKFQTGREVIYIWISTEDKKTLQKEARRRDLSFSSLVRSVLMNAAGHLSVANK
jgi:hypothetical protein